jgi:hypothetical protein
MTIRRMEHVGIVVDDLAATTAFFIELGLNWRDSPAPPSAEGHDPMRRHRLLGRPAVS